MSGSAGTELRCARASRRLPRLLDFTVLAVFALLAVGYLWQPVERALYHSPLLYNEGWNVYHGAEVAAHVRLYGEKPGYTATNYPPLYFHVLAWFGPDGKRMLFAGRGIALLSMAGIALLVGGLARMFTGGWGASILSSLLCLLCFGSYGRAYVGVNDPQMLSLAVVLMGVWFFLKRPESFWLGLFVPALTICCGLFIKHSTVVFPAAITVAALFSERRRFWRWMALLAGMGTTLLAVSLALHGRYMFEQILNERVYDIRKSFLRFMEFINPQQIPFVVAVLWAIWHAREPRRRVLVLALGLGAGYGFWATGAVGTNVNHFFDLLVAVCVICGIACEEAARAFRDALPQQGWVAHLFPLVLAVGFLAQPEMPMSFMTRQSNLAVWRSRQETFEREAAYLASRPGPALCEELLLCQEAGKPLEYEPFGAFERASKSAAFDAGAQALLKRHRYATVQIDLAHGGALAPAARGRFTQGFMKVLLDHYQVAREGPERIFFIPRDRALEDSK
jgi:hypothetical protein